MIFQVVLTNLSAHIFTKSPTFHGLAIGIQELKNVDLMDITIYFLGNAVMDKIMVGSTLN
jgi:hypothetical protein